MTLCTPRLVARALGRGVLLTLLALGLGCQKPAGFRASGAPAVREPHNAMRGASPEAGLVKRGVELLQQGDCRAAIAQAFDPAIAIYQSMAAMPDTTFVYSRGGRFGAAAGLTAALLNVQPKNVADGALEGIPNRTIRMSGPDFPDSLYFKGYCLSELGDIEGARAAVNAALVLMPGDPMYLCELGDQAQRRQEWEPAMEVFREAQESARLLAVENDVAASPLGRPPVLWQTRALRGIGYSLIELRRLDESEEVYREVLRLDPNDAKAKQELEYIATLRTPPEQ